MLIKEIAGVPGFSTMNISWWVYHDQKQRALTSALKILYNTKFRQASDLCRAHHSLVRIREQWRRCYAFIFALIFHLWVRFRCANRSLVCFSLISFWSFTDVLRKKAVLVFEVCFKEHALVTGDLLNMFFRIYQAILEQFRQSSSKKKITKSAGILLAFLKKLMSSDFQSYHLL